MEKENDQIKQLQEKLNQLLQKQNSISQEMASLQDEISNLASFSSSQAIPEEKKAIPAKPIPPIPEEKKQEPSVLKRVRPDVEKFIGENLINKIGILITVIGVGIGAKYAVDHEMISPLTRIMLGYLVGAGLLVFAMRLKTNYEAFSAVLLSGALAIMYFLTFAAYSFYELIPKLPTFGLMVIFTAFTVFAAIKYNRQIIAHMGLVGAYAVPFLLSDGTGEAVYLFAYMTILNLGILAISFKKYWKALYFVAFGFTWLIYLVWLFGSSHYEGEDFGLALTFCSIFFGLFYLTFLVYKLEKQKKFAKGDVFLVLSNSFIFYGLSYVILSEHEVGSKLLGLFTLANAIIHFAVCVVIYKKRLADRNLFFLIAGLVLVFITITIPVQLNGSWVTLLWAGEAVLLLWIGRTKNVPAYEKLAYPLIFLAFFSIIHDWDERAAFSAYLAQEISPFLNIWFVSSLIFTGSFAVINRLYFHTGYTAPKIPKFSRMLVQYSIPAILLISAYFTFQVEIVAYWNQLYYSSHQEFEGATPDYTLLKFKTIWLINYTMLFFSTLTWINIKKIRSAQLAYVNLALILLTFLVFLTDGLLALSELRDAYLAQGGNTYQLLIRYVAYGFAAFLLVTIYQYTRQNFMSRWFVPVYDFLLHITILWVMSSELIHWLNLYGVESSYKLGLSILWGVFALLSIALGIWKKKKHLRLGAIILFGITLIKLFFYDISHLNTIAKTIVFVSLGILLLIISFLYNRYKLYISDETSS